MKVCHLISNLDVGGAEVMLLKLLAATDHARVECRVISLIEKGPIGAKLEALGIPVTALGLRRGLPRPADLWRIRQAIAAADCDVLQTWMFHADLLGSLAVTGLRRAPAVVWNIRHSNLAEGVNKRSTFWTVRLCAAMSSRWPAKILANSEAGLRHHIDLGYAAERCRMIPNGFDLAVYRPSESDRAAIRTELGIVQEVPVIGHAGRFDPQKDHALFVAAAGRIAAVHPTARFVMCGRDVSHENTALWKAVQATGHAERFHLLGRRGDMPAVQASFDLAVSSSCAGEGFPNVIGEAMACGVPCVVTDVGGSAEVVGETGRVVPPRQPDLLAAACLELLGLPRTEFARLGLAARRRMETHYDIHKIAAQYEAVWREVAGRAVEPRRHAA
jgi:glycosyltransferase involved in cell wall biosynthesis